MFQFYSQLHAIFTIQRFLCSSGGLDMILVPGLAFSRQGHRLGRGGGFYDRYITWYREAMKSHHRAEPKLVSIAFQEQVLSEVPTEAHDVRIDRVFSA